jgi:hypothetical protein
MARPSSATSVARRAAAHAAGRGQASRCIAAPIMCEEHPGHAFVLCMARSGCPSTCETCATPTCSDMPHAALATAGPPREEVPLGS